MATINENFNFIHGDTCVKYFSINKIEGLPITEVYYTVKTVQNGKALLQKKLEQGIKLISEDNEKYHYAIIFNNCTDRLKSNVSYMHDIQVIAGNTKSTLLKGYLMLEEEVTTKKCEC
jgi:hypothetical protein